MGRARNTCIRNADWAVVFDSGRQSHVYRNGIDLAFRGNEIVHVGEGYSGPFDEELDGSGKLVIPGFVNIHGHLGTETLGKGFFEDLGNHNHYMSRLYEYIYVVRPPDAQTRRAATQVAVAELLLSGCTTVADMSIPYPGWLECLGDMRVRAYAAPMFKSASWSVSNAHAVEYVWDEATGEAGLQEALAVIEEAEAASSGLLGGILIPAQVDTCTPALLEASRDASARLNIPMQIHSGQTVLEFHEMIRRYGVTGTKFLADLNVLGPRTCLAHAIFLDRHPWIRWHEQQDLELLAETGTSVAHCPVTFAYRGTLMHDFGTYRKAGVNMAMGTDTHPHNMINEMRTALFSAKAARGHVDRTRTEDVFHAATLGGAATLGRNDIGRLAPGAKADIALVDLRHLTMQPNRDPLRSLVFAGGDRAITDVFVDGEQVVRDRKHLTIDLDKALADLSQGHALAMSGTSTRDWAKRSQREISPLSLPLVDG